MKIEEYNLVWEWDRIQFALRMLQDLLASESKNISAEEIKGVMFTLMGWMDRLETETRIDEE